MAQAVAARSYGLAEGYSTYAKSCDTTACQVYAGRAFQANDGSYQDLEGTTEFASSDQAVSATAGEVRVFAAGSGGPAGTVALTEFSSSTGGYTAGGAFPAVTDDGDSVAENPNHTWTATVSTSDIESAFGAAMGALQAVQVTGRNGLGDLGGRVTSMSLVFAAGTVETSGDRFAAELGLRSDWFTVTAQPIVSPPAATPPAGPPRYHVLLADGRVYAFGGAPDHGSLDARAEATTAVGIGETAGGYDILAGDGAVYVFGSASWFGSLHGKGLNAPPFQLATTPDGQGYWIVAFDGGIFSFGDARFYGSTGNLRLNQPVVGMAPTADGGGYWLVAADGGIFSFGDASYRGSLPGSGVQARTVGLAAAGSGYLTATSDGRVYGFGTAASGGPASVGATAPTVAVGLAR